MGMARRGMWVVSVSCALLIMSVTAFSGWAQGVRQSPYSAPDVLRRGVDAAPYGPSALPGAAPMGVREPDSILLTPELFRGILPLIPNLQAGYKYSFGKGVSSGRLTLDYLLPIRIGDDAAVFGEFHTEWQDFWKTLTRGADNRVDLSIGGGYRKIFGGSTLLGVNGFYDTTRLGNRWYPSGGVGFEFAALFPGNDVGDLTFNWYGNLFNTNEVADVFRHGPSNYDVRAGYSHELWNGGPDLRLSASGYRFSAGTGVYGMRGGAELRSRDGMLTLKYEAAHDRVNRTYHTVGGFVNVGFRLSNLFNGESPFVLPEPIFSSPRNLTALLTEPAKREYTGPAGATIDAAGTSVVSLCPQCVDPPGRTLVAQAVVVPGTIPPSLVPVCDSSISVTFPPGTTEAQVCLDNPPAAGVLVRFEFFAIDGCNIDLGRSQFRGPDCAGSGFLGASPIESIQIRNFGATPYNPGRVLVRFFQ